MKLKRKLAKEYASKPNRCHNLGEGSACYHGFLEGFEVAREMAAQWVGDHFHYPDGKGLYGPLHIMALGEEEVE